LEQPSQAAEDVEGDVEWKVAKIVESEVITSKRRVRGVNKEYEEL